MSAGTVVFDGSPVDRAGRRRCAALRRRVQMVFQDPTGALNPRHTIYEAVAEGIRIHKVAGHEPTLVADALARAGLRPPERYVRRYPHEVSGGQRQRVLIAGAMALGPQLLLADEPVASLDASIRGEILALMRGLVDEHGICIIAVTHDLGLAWNIADRVAVMYLGRIVEVGADRAGARRPAAPVHPGPAVGRAREANGWSQQILTGETPDPSRIPTGCRFHPRCPLVASGQAARLGIEQACRGVDVDLVELDPRSLRRVPRLRLTPIAPPPVLSASDEPPLRSEADRSPVWAIRTCGGTTRATPGWRTVRRRRVATSSMTTWTASASDRTSTVPTVEHVASGQRIVNAARPFAHARPGSTVDTPSSPSYTSSIDDTVQSLVVAAVSRPHPGLATEHVVRDAPHHPVGLVARRSVARREHVRRFGEAVDDRDAERDRRTVDARG